MLTQGCQIGKLFYCALILQSLQLCTQSTVGNMYMHSYDESTPYYCAFLPAIYHFVNYCQYAIDSNLLHYLIHNCTVFSNLGRGAFGNGPFFSKWNLIQIPTHKINKCESGTEVQCPTAKPVYLVSSAEHRGSWWNPRSEI